MILYVKGNLFQSPAQTLVNAVNTVGVMGKGIALEFRRLFPEMFEQYRYLCESRQLDIGKLWLYKTPNKWILNFPTKRHWRQPSRIEYIEAGLCKFVDSYSEMGIHSIAFPPLGCGNGQLDFKTQVQPLMNKYLRDLPIEVFIYPHKESDFVEHLQPEAMREWLRAEPTSLPFAEVWDDLVRLVSEEQDFKTVAKSSPFIAQVVQEPKGIEILSGSSQQHFIPYDDLVSFWQQLRTHGFTMRHIAPGIDRLISYLIPVFAKLEYVVPVHVADRFDNLANAVVGLQILPTAFSRTSQTANEVLQLSLLELE